MSSVHMPIMFHGEWIKQNDHYRFNVTNKMVTLNMHEFIFKYGDHDGQVNILDKTCNCQEFQLDQLSCEHVFACVGMDKHYLYMICVLTTSWAECLEQINSYDN